LTLENRVIWENLKAHPVWLGAFKTDLAAILGSTLAIIPVLTHNSLRANFIFLVEMLIVVKWPQGLIDVFDSLIFDVVDHKLVILKSEIVVYLLYIRIEPFPQIDLNISLDFLEVFLHNYRVGQICVELVKAVKQLFNFFLQAGLLMIEFNKGVLLHVADDLSGHVLELIHRFSKLVLLLKHFIPY